MILRSIGLLFLSLLALPLAAESTSTSMGSMAAVKHLNVDRSLSEVGKSCIDCHKEVTPGQVADW